jgi:glycine hydroxymethyltransferase
MADIAHISGLVAAEEADDPFPYCDIVTTTTHKVGMWVWAGAMLQREPRVWRPVGREHSECGCCRRA